MAMAPPSLLDGWCDEPDLLASACNFSVRQSVDDGRPKPKDVSMPQMFDWIFYAIVVIPAAYIVWDWRKNR